MLSVAQILHVICDDKSLKLFNAISTKGGNSEELLVRIKLTRKEYYARMSRLVKAGMVKRKEGGHFLTAFGKIVFDAQRILIKAVEYDWKLRAIDSVNSSDGISANERERLVDTLIEDIEVKEILLRRDA
jgi:hypothetical protein